ncbi:MAG: hypothetical protein IKF14_09605 [Atopobiaceae bacterium]|nr:hypothetical protein [Atopobiaceae bacterium]
MGKKSFEEQAQSIEAQIAMLRERRREVMARESEADRKGETAVRYAIGGLVLEMFKGGWRSVDLDRLEHVIGRNGEAFATCVAPTLPVEEAAARTRMWQRAHRERIAGKGEGSEEGAVPGAQAVGDGS